MTTDAAEPLAASVLICSRNRPELLIDTVRSVLAGEAVPRELVVVDQSSVAHPVLRNHTPFRGCEIRYVHSPTKGLSRARNIALRAARSDVAVLIDDDMFVEPQWLTRLLEGSVGRGPCVVATGRVLAGPPEGAGYRVPAAALFAESEPVTYRGRQPREVVPGANIALPRDLVLRLGGFDERLGAGSRFASADDNDMGFRLLEAGCEVRHVPSAVVFHRAWRSTPDLARMRWSYGRGKGAFYAKHASLQDRQILLRMVTDAWTRVRRVFTNLTTSPATSAGQLVYLAGMISGALQWWISESRVRRPEGTRDLSATRSG